MTRHSLTEKPIQLPKDEKAGQMSVVAAVVVAAEDAAVLPCPATHSNLTPKETPGGAIASHHQVAAK
eukprot:CAMPEP_0202506926 /NCGR_PEP_ID=MMETSP1361-20130828/51448_1 /ASSEMBLY_ACC=CAM_ASM_000849 /TAXON_ID=210615 /ORGANISM="Staurosira complex sp., Strain CCMP2646" /LENGTH=66 /DNA_ID=CAMNT_0049141009 /DNA_START=419 /DNA_END=619 /DNA_ORIENTATION=-